MHTLVLSSRDLGFTAKVPYGTPGLNGLQYGNDLMFGESDFTHGDLLTGKIQRYH